MAKGRGGRGPSRMDLRRQNEVVESREGEEVEETEEVEDEDAEEDEDSDGEADGEIDDEALEVDGDEPEPDEDAEIDEDAPKKKKAKAKKKPAVKKATTAKPKRTKAVKIVRQRAVWKVFDNGGKIMGTFDFPNKADAEALLAAKVVEKEGKTTFYIQLVKEAIEE